MQQPVCRPQTISDPRWKTRFDAFEEDLGWGFAGTGSGLCKYVWSEPDFVGTPRLEGFNVPHDYRPDHSGVTPPGSVRWTGRYRPGSYLGQALSFQIAVGVGGGYARMLVDGELILGAQTDEWARRHRLESLDTRLRPLKGNVLFAGAEMLYVEMISDPIDIASDRPVPIELEYSVTSGFNVFGCKNFKRGVGGEQGHANNYDWMETLSEDLCYPDHFMVHPQRVRPGEDVYICWHSSSGADCRIDGEPVAAGGIQSVKVMEERTFRFTSDSETTERTVTIQGQGEG